MRRHTIHVQRDNYVPAVRFVEHVNVATGRTYKVAEKSAGAGFWNPSSQSRRRRLNRREGARRDRSVY